MSMYEDQTQPPPDPIRIADVGLPVDSGLSGLGLLMSLTGALFLVMALGIASMLVFTLLLAHGNLRGAGTVVLIALGVLTTTILRSWAHRAAGQRLLYDGPGTPRSAMQRYFLFCALQIALIAIALGSQGLAARTLGLITIVLASWPVALAIVLAGARFKALLDQQTIPQGEDKGFEGAAILMIVLGLTGLLVGIVTAIDVIEQLGETLHFAPFLGLGLTAIVTMMIVRSAFHVQAGVRGVLEAHCDRTASAAAQYGNFAVVAGGVICGLFLLMMLTGIGGHRQGPEIFMGLITAVFLMWGLATWPLLIRRFFVERQFADLMVSGEGTHTRAPDRGLTTLGWFLFGQAVMGLAMALPALLAAGPMDPDDYRRARDPMSQLFAAFQIGDKSQWWAMGATVLQLVASWQLIRMRPSHKLLVTIWSATATLVAVYVNYPILKAMSSGVMKGAFRGGEAMLGNLSFMMVALSLVTPIATFILVNRKQRDLPTAVLQR